MPLNNFQQSTIAVKTSNILLTCHEKFVKFERETNRITTNALSSDSIPAF